MKKHFPKIREIPQFDDIKSGNQLRILAASHSFRPTRSCYAHQNLQDSPPKSPGHADKKLDTLDKYCAGNIEKCIERDIRAGDHRESSSSDRTLIHGPLYCKRRYLDFRLL